MKVTMAKMRKIAVELGERSYEVTVGAGLLAKVGAAASSFARRAVIVTDTNVAPLYADAVQESLAKSGVETGVIDFPAGEPHKDLSTYEAVMDRLFGLTPPIDRDSLIVALGGGVVGDLAGFVAATALRGIRFMNVPTSLLAAVDASVGGKTGLDVAAGKNLIGAFHQPMAVIIDSATLKTLPPGELASGLAECVKHAIIRDGDLLTFIEDNAPAILAAQEGVLADLIARNVAIKAAVVAADERESGQRAHLNFGHTIGHAIETAAGYGAISHGQAVALGMVAACGIAVRRGLLAAQDAQRVRAALTALSLPVRFADVPGLRSEARDPDQLRGIMARDKKAREGVVRFVLPTELGSVDVFSDVSEREAREAILALSAC